MAKYILLFAIIFGLISCVKDPVKPATPDNPVVVNGVLVLCEGLMGGDNSTLAYINEKTGEIAVNYYGAANPGFRLGDIANDILLFGDSAFVSVSGPGTIEALSVKSGKTLGRLTLPKNSMPRTMKLINDSTAYVSLLFNQGVLKFNPKTMKILQENIACGPYPEGLDYCGSYLFTANSGYGDFKKDLPKAGTVSALDLNTGSEVANMPCGANPIEVLANRKTGKVYVAYYNLPSLKDSLGGIIEYDAATLKMTRRWYVRATDICLSPNGDNLYFINGNTNGVAGIAKINLTISNPQPELVVTNPKSSEIWYSLAISPDGKNVWIGNAFNFTTSGEVLVYELANPSSTIKRFKVGINPNKIMFF